MYQVDEIAGGEPGGGSQKGPCVVSIVNKETSRNRGHWGMAGADKAVVEKASVDFSPSAMEIYPRLEAGTLHDLKRESDQANVAKCEQVVNRSEEDIRVRCRLPATLPATAFEIISA